MKITFGLIVAGMATLLGYRGFRRWRTQPPAETTPAENARPCPRCKFTLGYADTPCRHCTLYPSQDAVTGDRP
ncbi:hypothetical protein [Ferrimonas balearica]|uniref:hypothetical protein n=1 Tax=Ferrimonas balearica TaxID=44012 RepID=UPI001C99EB6A|nr:hypothetical protein [Ferrimonas balearica]MBY5992245.1 hypothetical protein [Ferrimonas balearica]